MKLATPLPVSTLDRGVIVQATVVPGIEVNVRRTARNVTDNGAWTLITLGSDPRFYLVRKADLVVAALEGIRAV